MQAETANRFLTPAVLATISGLDLIAKTVVDGFVSGLHRSPDFGFSQEFAEYRAYTPGDDLRNVDWNVYARTDRVYLKRYRGETNTSLMVMLDSSASMGFGAPVTKLEYAKYLAAALVYLAHLQRDSAGLIVFHDIVSNFLEPSSRHGQLMRLLHGIDTAALGKGTNLEASLQHALPFIKRRGITVVISDCFDHPENVIKSLEPLRFRGSELILFHLLDKDELEPDIHGDAYLQDMETGQAIEASPDFLKNEYRQKITAHVEAMRSKAQGAGIDYQLIRTDRPLDQALREYLTLRQGQM
jgi:uncharacterized protein (DUF58 family)